VKVKTEKKRDASRGSSDDHGSSSFGRESYVGLSSVLLPCQFLF
jgi:predicted porin